MGCVAPCCPTSGSSQLLEEASVRHVKIAWMVALQEWAGQGSNRDLGIKRQAAGGPAIRIVEGSIYAKPRNSRSRRMTHDLLDPVRPSRKDGAVAGTRALWVYVAVVPGCRSGSGHPRQRDNRCSLRTRDRRGGGSRCRLDAASPANEIASRLTRASSREREAAAMLRGRVRR